ncbi:transporter [Marinivivus vitaminiproducens]|uniref:transporter n=1 Tax=Marinivivus vitaminiproducens TaxID=3035935 RepID=UPI00279B3D86|nr:transporter [Geminicoccaceae bacterium SCSIO 64248]
MSVVLSFALATTALSAFPTAVLAQESSDPVALQRALQERDERLARQDALIEELSRRLSAIEDRLPPPPAGTQTRTATAEPPVPTRSAAPGPGQFEVEPEDAERALERTLTREGVLLLPPGYAEITPSFQYSRVETTGTGGVPFDGQIFAGDNKIKRDEMIAAVDLRVGLPFDAQAELRVPYNIVHSQQTGELDFLPVDESSDTGDGFGKLQVGLAKTLLRERSWRPDLVGRVIWEADTGSSQDNGVALQSGGHAFTAELTALKRQDPLAFIAAGGYTWNTEDDDLRPGNEIFLSLGAALAVTPETSLRASLDQIFADDLELDGDTIGGTDSNQTSLTLGGSVLVHRNTLLDVAFSAGLTDDAPDYSVLVSLPIRFETPSL